MASGSRYEDIVVETFGGGLNLSTHPAFLRNDEWSWCFNVFPIGNASQCANAIELVVDTYPGSFEGYTIGIDVNPYESSQMLVTQSDGVFDGDLYLFRLDASVASPSPIAIAPLGGTRAEASMHSKAGIGFLNDQIIVSAGFLTGAATRTVVSMTGVYPLTYSIVAPSGALAPAFLTSFAGRIVAAKCNRNNVSQAVEARRIAWSDAGDPTVWDPSLANSADDLILDDAAAEITGMGELGGNAFAVGTRNNLYAFSPSRSIPAFTRDVLASGIGVWSPMVGQVGSMKALPFGLGFIGPSANLYVLTSGGSLEAVSSKVSELIASIIDGQTFSTQPTFMEWHPRFKHLVLGLWNSSYALTWNPASNAWSRLYFPDLRTIGETATLYPRYSVVMPTGYNSKLGDWWITSGNHELWRESADNVPLRADAAWVETKDFHIGHDLLETSSIFVDWECLTNASTDTLAVYHQGRNDFAKVDLGQQSFRSGDGTWIHVANLVGGESEVAVRKTARFHRFAFGNAAGRFRIRGFKIKVAKAGDHA